MKFICPWPPQSNPRDSFLHPPSFKIPRCYNTISPPLVKSVLDNMLDQSLFYVFYTSPGDIAQAFAMKKLYANQWLYHKIERKWYKNNAYEWVYFDVECFEEKPAIEVFPDKSDFVTEQEVDDNILSIPTA